MQIEHIGRGSLSKLGSELNKLALEKVLLVTGKKSFVESGARAAVLPHLADHAVEEFSEFSPNPLLSEVMAGVEIYREKELNGIIAIGGGSCIDVAKSISAVARFPGQELDIVLGNKKLENKLDPLIAIPTTAGTGSEATHFAVVYVDGNKYSLASDWLLPSVSIVDASFTDSLPRSVSAPCGFDAMSQAVESFWSRGSTKQSRFHSRRAISLLLNSLVAACDKGNSDARDDVMLAANDAGKSINLTKTTAPHALSYCITSKYGLPHGHAAALTLGVFFVLHDQLISAGSENVHPEFTGVCEELYQMLGVTTAGEAMHRWYGLMRACGLETNLKTIGIEASDVPEVVSRVNAQRLSNHPIELGQSDLEYVFTILLREDHLP